MSSSGQLLVLQARVGSTRLPGKMLRKVGDFRLIDWVLYRLSSTRCFTERVLATSDSSRDDALVQAAESYGYKVFRGSESDVLGRFVGVATRFNPELIARVCCDNPFVDPSLVDSLVDQFLASDDLLFNHRPIREYSVADGFGAELFTTETLLKLHSEVREPGWREHVTLGVYEGVVGCSWRGAAVPECLQRPNLRFDVDSEEDLIRLTSFVFAAGVSKDDDASTIVGKFDESRAK